jgi:hypothetical protein
VVIHSFRQQQKNMTDQLGHQVLEVLNTARNNLAGCGTQTAALAFGGQIAPVLQEQQNYMMAQLGQNPNSMGTARYTGAGAGTQTAGLAFGGRTPAATGATQEFTGAGTPVTKTVTVS